jgi:hypothetical protein
MGDLPDVDKVAARGLARPSPQFSSHINDLAELRNAYLLLAMVQGAMRRAGFAVL